MTAEKMSRRHIRHSSGYLHHWVYDAMACLALWLAISAWGFDRHGAYTSLELGVVSVLILVAVAVPVILGRIWRGHRPAGDGRRDGGRFVDWVSDDFEIWQGRCRARDAVLEILLPIAAVAFGLTAFAIVFALTG
jgi:hypothetical protein